MFIYMPGSALSCELVVKHIFLETIFRYPLSIYSRPPFHPANLHPVFLLSMTVPRYVVVNIFLVIIQHAYEDLHEDAKRDKMLYEQMNTNPNSAPDNQWTELGDVDDGEAKLSHQAPPSEISHLRLRRNVEKTDLNIVMHRTLRFQSRR